MPLIRSVVRGFGEGFADGLRRTGPSEFAKGMNQGIRARRHTLNFVKKHPVIAGTGLAAAGTGGYLLGSRKKKPEPENAYQLDTQTGVVYFNGQALGEVRLY